MIISFKLHNWGQALASPPHEINSKICLFACQHDNYVIPYMAMKMILLQTKCNITAIYKEA